MSLAEAKETARTMSELVTKGLLEGKVLRRITRLGAGDADDGWKMEFEDGSVLTLRLEPATGRLWNHVSPGPYLTSDE